MIYHIAIKTISQINILEEILNIKSRKDIKTNIKLKNLNSMWVFIYRSTFGKILMSLSLAGEIMGVLIFLLNTSGFLYTSQDTLITLIIKWRKNNLLWNSGNLPSFCVTVMIGSNIYFLSCLQADSFRTGQEVPLLSTFTAWLCHL